MLNTLKDTGISVGEGVASLARRIGPTRGAIALGVLALGVGSVIFVRRRQARRELAHAE